MYVNFLLMDPNWSSGPRSGNKDRVRIITQASLGKWVDKKTPKDVFTPPSTPHNPKLKKQKYTPTDIYKYKTTDETTQTSVGPNLEEVQNLPPQDLEGYLPDMEVSTAESNNVDEIMSEINNVQETRSFWSWNPFVRLLPTAPVEPSGNGNIVVGDSVTNVETNIPGRSTGHRHNLRPRLIDNDRSAVDRVYIPSRVSVNPTTPAIVNNPANPNEPVARFSDHTTVTITDSENNVVVNDSPENITTADVLRARRDGIGNLTVNVDQRPERTQVIPAEDLPRGLLAPYNNNFLSTLQAILVDPENDTPEMSTSDQRPERTQVIPTEDLPRRLVATNNTANNLFSTLQAILVDPEIATPEMSTSGGRSSEVLQAAESAARVLAASRNTMDTMNNSLASSRNSFSSMPSIETAADRNSIDLYNSSRNRPVSSPPSELRRAVRNFQPYSTFRAPSGLTSSDEDLSSLSSSLGSSLDIATNTVENVVESAENLAVALESSGQTDMARPLREAAVQARQNIRENILVLEAWDNPPPTPLPDYDPNEQPSWDYSNAPDPHAPRNNVTISIEEQHADVERAISLLEPNPIATHIEAYIERNRAEILRRNPRIGVPWLRRSLRLASNRRDEEEEEPSSSYNLRPRRRTE